MCDPLMLAGVALSAAGAYSQGQTQAAYVDAQNAANQQAFNISRMARQEEQARQEAWEQEGQDRVDDTADKMSREQFDQEQQARADDFVTQIQNADKLDASAAAPSTDGASVDVKDAMTKRLNKAANESRERIKALAAVQGYGGTLANRGQTQREAGDFLSILGGKRRGSLAVANQEQNIPAATVRPGNDIFGQIMSGLGGMLAYGGSGMFGGTGGSVLPWAKTSAAPHIVRPKARPAVWPPI